MIQLFFTQFHKKINKDEDAKKAEFIPAAQCILEKKTMLFLANCI
jgi:hypothetical protein